MWRSCRELRHSGRGRLGPGALESCSRPDRVKSWARLSQRSHSAQGSFICSPGASIAPGQSTYLASGPMGCFGPHALGSLAPSPSPQAQCLPACCRTHRCLQRKSDVPGLGDSSSSSSSSELARPLGRSGSPGLATEAALAVTSTNGGSLLVMLLANRPLSCPPLGWNVSKGCR